MKKSPARMSQASACYKLLEALARLPLPAVISAGEDIHKVLALRSAGLIEAETSMPICQSGERKIESAQVTAITSEGRATLQRAVGSAFRWG